MSDPVSGGLFSWAIGKIMDRLTKFNEKQITTRQRLDDLKAKAYTLNEQNEQLIEALNRKTAERLRLQTDNKILRAQLADSQGGGKKDRN